MAREAIRGDLTLAELAEGPGREPGADDLRSLLPAPRRAERQPHPEQGELTVAQVLEIERSALQPMLGPFDRFNESEHAVTGTYLISFDRNRYSASAERLTG